jgi:hypothetical protein
MWSSADIEAQLQVILRGLDLMFDRARATLDRTPYISRCWLNALHGHVSERPQSASAKGPGRISSLSYLRHSLPAIDTW